MEILVPLAVALVGLMGAIAGFAVNWFKSKEDSKQARRTERHKYLISAIQQLADAYTKYERYLNTKEGSDEEHAEIIGQAIAACLMTADTYALSNENKADFEKILSVAHTDAEKETENLLRERNNKYGRNLTFIAIRRLTRNRVGESADTENWPEVKVFGKYRDRNRNGLIVAMQRLSELIAEFQ